MSTINDINKQTTALLDIDVESLRLGTTAGWVMLDHRDFGPLVRPQVWRKRAPVSFENNGDHRGYS